MLLTRYLLRQEGMAIMLVTIVVTCAIWFSQSLKLLEMVVNGGAPMFVFVQLMVLVLPSFLSPIMPVALFLGLLFTMQKLVQDQEWIVMQGAGLGPWQLARPALMLAVGAMVLHWAISIDIAPGSQRELRMQRHLIQTDYAGALLREGTFNAIGKNMMIYVHERTGSNFFKGILIHDTRSDNKSITLTAEEGFLVSDKGPPRLIIQCGTRQERNNTTGEIGWLSFEQYVVDMSALNDAQGGGELKPFERPITDLFNPPANADNPNAPREFLAEANQRIAFPLYNLAFAMVALVAILGGDFSRRGRPRRYVLAVLLVVLMQSGALTFANMASRNNVFIPLQYAAPLLMIAMGALWLAHIGGRRA